MKKLTPTSYAVLGLLAIRPWSAYELIRQIKRSTVRLVWPRAESKLYEEPKNLAAHGLAAATSEEAGGRRRAVYHITPKGRRALARWLDEPGEGLLLEFEAMIKVVYGDFGTKAQLLRNIRRIREGLARRSSLALGLARELADAGPRFPKRAHINAISDRFIIDMMETAVRWSEWAEAIVSQWPGTALDGRMAAKAKALLNENAGALERVARKDERGGREGPEPRSEVAAGGRAWKSPGRPKRPPSVRAARRRTTVPPRAARSER